MNIEKIKYFIDLVECKNFTDTAKKNYVSQTTISQQIASLEKEFGVLLIDRKKIPVEPTQAGRLFYSEAILLWKQYNQMKTKMMIYQQGCEQIISIEYAASTDIQLLLEIIPPFQKEHPNIKIQLNKVLLKDIAEYLKKGIYDMAITFDSELYDSQNILTQSLYQGNYCAMVSKTHPLYHASFIHINELYEYPLVMLNPTVIGTSYYQMIQRAIEEGYEPKIQRTVDDVETELFYIVTENLIGFFPDNYQSSYIGQNVKLIPLKNSQHKFEIVAGFLKENTNDALHTFLKYMQNSFLQ
ncbi:LysR family transcriptional regulator [Candidatus Galacturonibacter soehngenii]|uniref:LysR family transcriptional regulator n=1 Tax=Candidatus Galacturonatibacter soehngenii TaxID=2307010 RepID=A0A7V7QJT8_9FIRM|nr:LysR family transcriptional regulator [Candidatus Galacturonibacter soehngenii]KAB1437967.1 LysR family transcriptional regulator [Candidatus Galacturonibacter soehngenii]